MPYIDPRAFDSLDAKKTGAFYSILGDLNGTGSMPCRFDDAPHTISNMVSKYDAGSVAATAPATGVMWATPIHLPAGYTCTKITFTSGTTAGATLTHQWFGLATSDFKIMATTADDTSTPWAASTDKQLTISKVNGATAGAYTVPVTTEINRPVLYYALILITATTVPTLACQVGGLAAVTRSPASGVTDQTGKTTPVLTDSSITLAIATPNVNVPYVGVV